MMIISVCFLGLMACEIISWHHLMRSNLVAWSWVIWFSSGNAINGDEILLLCSLNFSNYFVCCMLYEICSCQHIYLSYGFNDFIDGLFYQQGFQDFYCYFSWTTFCTFPALDKFSGSTLTRTFIFETMRSKIIEPVKIDSTFARLNILNRYWNVSF